MALIVTFPEDQFASIVESSSVNIRVSIVCDIRYCSSPISIYPTQRINLTFEMTQIS